MTVQVLVATMHQTDHSLLERMNIQTDVVVINQCDIDSVERFIFRGHSVLWISMTERGVGLSRNTALMRATGDILLFADDDVSYLDGYADIIASFFEKHTHCDFATFNLESQNQERIEKLTLKDYRLHWYNSMKFGTFRLAIRKNSIRKTRVCFSHMFGGGTIYQSGEDTLFIQECLKKGLRGMASSIHIGTVLQRTSTWFKGYNEKYYHDRGVLMRQVFGMMSYPLTMMHILKNPNQYKDIGLIKACKSAFVGICEKI